MEYLVPKAPSDVIDYVLDWSMQLDDDWIDTFFVEVTAGTIVLGPTPANYGRAIGVTVSGGAAGETAAIYCVINTNAGQTFTRTTQLQIEKDAQSLLPATGTKGQIVNMAFEEVGLAGYEFDATASEQASALRRLDTLMAQWRTLYPALNYNAPATIGSSAMGDAAGVPDDALQAVVTSLALRIAPGIGKTMSVEARVAYSQSMALLRARYGVVMDRRLPASTPRGAGAKPWSTWLPFNGFFAVADLGGQLSPVLVTQGGADITTEGGTTLGL